MKGLYLLFVNSPEEDLEARFCRAFEPKKEVEDYIKGYPYPMPTGFSVYRLSNDNGYFQLRKVVWGDC